MLSAVINYMDHDSFHLISVLDDKFGLIGICTENDIMEAMTDENVNMTFEQLLNKQKEKEGNRQS
jgi:CBS-domain-containing membrane protein